MTILPQADIQSIDQEGRGVARVNEKVLFIDGALPTERVSYRLTKQKPTFDKGQIVEIVRKSPQRVDPLCEAFGRCGGCSFQHLSVPAQVAVKQKILEDQLLRIGLTKPEQMLAPIVGPSWGYRHRARLSVRYVRKKDKMLVGFREKSSSYVADMDDCHILVPSVGKLLRPLADVIDRLSIRERIPQIEVAAGDDQLALVLRHMEPLSDDDRQQLSAFAEQYGIIWFLQPGGLETVAPLEPDGVTELVYEVPDFNVALAFGPTHFTQINPGINRMLIRTAMTLLGPQKGERIADFFCGLGNFTLPIARLGADTVGFEGSQALVDRALKNAQKNGLSNRVSAWEQNLFKIDETFFDRHGPFDAALIDPPREGAAELVKALPDQGFKRIVYISCHSATLARDTAILTTLKGYTLKKAGIANMFPHTSHFESIALFERYC